jgi:hypothetical protein
LTIRGREGAFRALFAMLQAPLRYICHHAEAGIAR